MSYPTTTPEGNGSTGFAAMDEAPLSIFTSIVLPTIFCIVFVTGLLGNSLVIYIMKTLYSSTRVSDLFLINLAVADVLAVCILPLWATQYALGSQWIFGTEMCKISSWCAVFTAYATTFFIAIMSLDRLGAVVFNEKTRKLRTTKAACIVTVILWCLALAMGTPALHFRNTVSDYGRHYPEYCKWFFDDRIPSHYTWYLVHTGFRFLGGFVLPLLIITICYVAIIIYLKKRKSQKEALRKKQNKITSTITVVIIVFVICWLPNQISASVYTAQAFGIMVKPELPNEIQDTFHLVALALIWGHSCFNPFLYAFMRDDVKNKMKQIVSNMKKFCCKSKIAEDGQSGTTKRLLKHSVKTFGYNEPRTSPKTNSFFLSSLKSKQSSSFKLKSKFSVKSAFTSQNEVNTKKQQTAFVKYTPSDKPGDRTQVVQHQSCL